MDITNYIPVIITSSVAIFVMFIGQILNSCLTNKREERKYKKEVYEKFISKHFIKILAYPYAVSRLIEEELIEKEVSISTKLNEMFSDIHYGNNRLQSIFISYNTLGYITENHLYNNQLKATQFKICYYFLLYSKEIFEDIDFKLEKNVKNLLNYTIKEYAVLSIYSEAKGYDEAKNMLISIRRFHLNSLSKIPLKEIEKMTQSQIMNILEKELEDYLAN